jgi:peptidoglycan/xylan/chitin deacetylase (PgdA/CDA1 family)
MLARRYDTNDLGLQGVTHNQKFCCLTYHVVGDGPSQYHVSEPQLRAQLALLVHNVFVMEGFEELECRLNSSGPLPYKYVTITVDDGHESSMRAAEIFEQHGSKATFFLTRDRSRNRLGFIRNQDIRELRSRGFSMGTHGTTHRKLTLLSPQDCAHELAESKHWLEDVLGEEIRYMAAPGGFINERVFRLASECNYVLSATCCESMNSPESMKLPSRVNRVNVRRHFSLRTFHRAVEGDPGFYAWRQLRSAALALPKQLLR